MRVLVTGGAGFIGSHVADAALAAGHEVLVIDDLSSGRRQNVPEAAGFEQGDIRDDAFVARVFDAFRPELVDHQAAQTSVSLSTREPVRDATTNVVGTINLLAHSVRLGVQRVVFASTGGAIYGEVPEGERAAVGREPQPLSPYACSKFACEAYLRAYEYEHGLRYTILRYSNVYGPRQDPHGEAGVVAIFTQRLLAGEPIRINARVEVGDEGCVRDFVYVGDVVRANMRALAGEISVPIVNVCSGVPTTIVALAQTLMQSTGADVDIGYAPRRAGDVERSVLQGGEAAVPEGATSLSRGLDQTVAWFRTR